MQATYTRQLNSINPTYVDLPTLNTDYGDLDRVCDWIPGLSILTNVIDIFIKIGLCFVDRTTIKNNHYLLHLRQKSFSKCILLFIPGLGPLLVHLFEKYKDKKIEELKAGRISWDQVPFCFRYDIKVVLTGIEKSPEIFTRIYTQLDRINAVLPFSKAEFARAAVKRNPHVIRYIEKEDSHYLLLALEALRGNATSLKNLHTSTISDNQFWLEAVASNGEVLKEMVKAKEKNGPLDFDTQMRFKDIAFAAIISHPSQALVNFVKEKLPLVADIQFFKLAIAKRGFVYHCLPPAIQNDSAIQATFNEQAKEGRDALEHIKKYLEQEKTKRTKYDDG